MQRLTTMVLAILFSTVAAAQTPPSKSHASKGAPAKSATFTIQGILTGDDGIPLAEWPPDTSVTALPVSKDEEHSDTITFDLGGGRLHFYNAELLPNGSFRIRVTRGDVPATKPKLKLTLSRSSFNFGGGMRPLQKDGKDILIDAATAPATVNLGKVTIAPAAKN